MRTSKIWFTARGIAWLGGGRGGLCEYVKDYCHERLGPLNTQRRNDLSQRRRIPPKENWCPDLSLTEMIDPAEFVHVEPPPDGEDVGLRVGRNGRAESDKHEVWEDSEGALHAHGPEEDCIGVRRGTSVG